MVEVITFSQALEQTEDVKRHLLLGNGFSISLFPERFRYGSLLEEADFSALPEARQAFDELDTTDFEVVVYALKQTVALLPIYAANENIVSKIHEHSEKIKELLVQAIAGRHPERPSDITEEQYQACRKFLANFIGKSRKQTNKNLRGSVYSLNYDLLLYWTLLHTQITISYDDGSFDFTVIKTEEMAHDDGFRAPDDDPDAEYVSWDGEVSHTQCIHYLHGALHLYDYGHELQKKCWERSGGTPLIEQVRAALDEGKFPLFVSEGDSKEKFERIRHSAYLHKSLRSFRANCEVKNAVLFIFGHSLADNDIHILKQIEKGKIKSVYISLYGAPSTPDNQLIITRARSIKAARNDRKPLDIFFFDAASANVWASS